MFKVLYLCLSPYMGGQERFALALAASASASGRFEVEFGVLKGAPLAALAAAADVAAVPFELRPLAPRPLFFFDLRFIGALASFLRSWRPDVIHLHGSMELFHVVCASGLAGLRRHTALVHHRHLVHRTPRGGFLRRMLYSAVDLAIAPSRSCAESLCRMRPCPFPVEVLPHPVDMRRFDPVRLGRICGVLRKRVADLSLRIVVTVTRVVEGKGCDRFVRMADLFLRRHAPALDWGDNVRFVLVGGGDAAYIEKLKAEVEYDARIIFLGEREDVESVLAEADLFVTFTEGEAFGLSVLEAMAMGLPILAPRVDGVEELLTSCGDCLFEPSVSLEHVCELVEERLDDTEQSYRDRVHRAIDQYHIDRYEFGRYLEKLEAFYERAVGRRRGIVDKGGNRRVK